MQPLGFIHFEHWVSLFAGGALNIYSFCCMKNSTLICICHLNVVANRYAKKARVFYVCIDFICSEVECIFSSE